MGGTSFAPQGGVSGGATGPVAPIPVTGNVLDGPAAVPAVSPTFAPSAIQPSAAPHDGAVGTPAPIATPPSGGPLGPIAPHGSETSITTTTTALLPNPVASDSPSHEGQGTVAAQLIDPVSDAPHDAAHATASTSALTSTDVAHTDQFAPVSIDQITFDPAVPSANIDNGLATVAEFAVQSATSQNPDNFDFQSFEFANSNADLYGVAISGLGHDDGGVPSGAGDGTAQHSEAVVPSADNATDNSPQDVLTVAAAHSGYADLWF